MIEFREETHQYFDGKLEVPSVSKILEQQFPFIARVSEEDLDLARNFGTAVHSATSYADNGVLDPNSLHPDIVPYLADWSQFRADTGASVIENELMVYSKVYRFAGTLDRIMKIGDKLVLVDIKTGTKVEKKAFLQIAGYDIAFFEETCSKVDERIVVQLTGKGYKIHRSKKKPEREETIFKGLAELYWY